MKVLLIFGVKTLLSDRSICDRYKPTSKYSLSCASLLVFTLTEHSNQISHIQSCLAQMCSGCALHINSAMFVAIRELHEMIY